MNNDLVNDLILAASTSTDPMSEIRVMTLSQFAFEHHFPELEVTVQPQLFMDGDLLSLALDVDVLDEFTHESVLLALLNLNEDVNLTRLDKPCLFGRPVAMQWHSTNETYVRGTPNVIEQSAI